MKKLIKIAFVAVFAVIAGYGVYANQKVEAMSDLVLANVEALARYELPEVEVTCGDDGGTCWYSSGDCYVTPFTRFEDCAFCGYTSYSCYTPC